MTAILCKEINHDQSWHSWRNRLHRGRIAASAGASSAGGIESDYLAQGSRDAGGRDVPQPARSGQVGVFHPRTKPVLEKCDVVFFATPNGIAMQQARALLDAGVKVIDLAADFRIKDVAVWEQWYKMEHACPDLVAEAVYGLPEINRAAIKGARLIANPGCYPTAVQLGFMPLLEAGAVDTGFLVADAKSGVSGAGRKAEIHMLFAEAADNFKAYGVAGHRHLPEIKQGLESFAGKPVGLTFVPHLTPMIRGIHATLYAKVSADIDLQSLFEQRYANEPFVDVMPAGILRRARCAAPTSAASRCIGRRAAIPWWCCR